MIRRVWAQLRPLLRSPRTDIGLVAGASAAAGAMEAAVLVMVVGVALAVAEGTADEPIALPLLDLEAGSGTVLVASAVLALAVVAVNAGVARLSAKLSSEVLESTRQRAVESYLAAPWEVQAAAREGSVQESATSLASSASALATQTVASVSATIGVSTLLLVALLVDPVVTVVVLAVGLTLFGVLRPVTRLTRRRSRQFVAANSEYAEAVARMTAMSMELRVFGVQRRMADILAARSAEAAARLRRTRFLSRFGSTLYRDMAVLFLVAAVAVLDAGSDATLAAFGTVVLLIVRSLGYSTMLQSSLQQISELSPHVEMLHRRLDELGAVAERVGTRCVDAFELIELRGVTYSYGGDRTAAVCDLDLAIRRGEVLGVVGPSGSGKSTLLQVVLRLRPPTEGSVLIDGLDYREIDPAAWSEMVAFVPQEPQLMEASVADNIAFIRPGVSRAAVERAADAAHIGDDIRALPQGFDTLLGPRGSGLSGGQKQRLAFARALLGEPRLLVLDEPTSALDGTSERRIQETIRELRGRVTMVIVAHRVSTLDVCDRVVSMSDGRLGAVDRPVA
jgi:ATP-binding cassette, subfamily B, bacterial